MFGKLASDALGLTDIGRVVSSKDYDKVESDDYIMHEDGEKIFFLIKSKSDEYCFTNKALIHVDGANAVSKKRTLYRYEYYLYNINNVTLETAGNIDLDVEIKFILGEKAFSIDVHKNDLEQLKDLYKALIKISEITRTNNNFLTFTNESIKLATTSLSNYRNEGSNPSEEFKKINEYAFQWMMESKEKYNIKDFSFVFQQFINS